MGGGMSKVRSLMANFGVILFIVGLFGALGSFAFLTEGVPLIVLMIFAFICALGFLITTIARGTPKITRSPITPADFNFDRELMEENPKFPLSIEGLWPSGQLLQLQNFYVSNHQKSPVRRHPIMILTPLELIIASMDTPIQTTAMSISKSNPGKALVRVDRFYEGSLSHEYRYDARSIARVTLGKSFWDYNEVTILMGKENGKMKRILSVNLPQGIPMTLLALQLKAMKQRLMSPKQSKQFYLRMLGLQFARAAPQAEIIFKGEQMPEEQFRRIVR